MILEIIQAFIFGTIPLAIFTWFLTLWALRSGHLAPYQNRKEFGTNIDAMTKARKDALKAEKARIKAEKADRKAAAKAAKNAAKKAEESASSGSDQETVEPVKSKAERAQGLVQEKWMRFGGNFYGTMIFITWLHIELYEVIDFITSMSWPERFDLGDIIGFFISVIIATIVNFIRAVIWFSYWPDIVESVRPWLLLVAAYIGYHIGAKYSNQRFRQDLAQSGSSETVDDK